MVDANVTLKPVVKPLIGIVLAVPLLGACATGPIGPSVMVMPGTNKPFEVFQADDAACRQWAGTQSGAPAASEVVAGNTVGGAAIGSLLGAGLGAAIGAAAGNPGIGAAVGAGSGLVLGTASGANAGVRAGSTVQRRYDMAYTQCMYAKGNQIPARAAPATPARRVYAAPPVPPPPPPPAAAPPAPPPPPPAAPPATP
jgi:hypothetical protein